MSLTVSVDVKQHWTMLRHWSQFVPNMSTRHPRTLSSTSPCSGLNHTSGFSINRQNWGVPGSFLRRENVKNNNNLFKYFSMAVLLVTLLNFHPNWWFGICRLWKPVQSKVLWLVWWTASRTTAGQGMAVGAGSWHNSTRRYQKRQQQVMNTVISFSSYGNILLQKQQPTMSEQFKNIIISLQFHKK